MNLSPVNYLKRVCTKTLFTVVLVAGFFIFSYPAAIPQKCFAAQTTEYVKSGIWFAKGYKYTEPLHGTYKRPTVKSVLFCKPNFGLFHNNKSAVDSKLNLQAVLSIPACSCFYFVKTVPQSGKNEPSSILG
jgi:hypothetical protein